MVKKLAAAFLAAAVFAPLHAYASDYDGRDRDGGYSYRHHRGEDDGYGDDRGNRYGNDGDCQSGGCGNKSRRCDRSSGDCRSSFSPGPFKDSPVVICAPYSCNSGSGDQSGGNRGGQGDQPPPRRGRPAPSEPQ